MSLEELASKMFAVCTRRAAKLRSAEELSQRERDAIAAMLDELGKQYHPKRIAAFRRQWAILKEHDPDMGWLPQLDLACRPQADGDDRDPNDTAV